MTIPATMEQVSSALREHEFIAQRNYPTMFGAMPRWVQARIARHMTYVANGEVVFCQHSPIVSRRIVPLYLPQFGGCRMAGCVPLPDYCDGCADQDVELYRVLIDTPGGRWSYQSAVCSWCLWQERPSTVA